MNITFPCWIKNLLSSALVRTPTLTAALAAQTLTAQQPAAPTVNVADQHPNVVASKLMPVPIYPLAIHNLAFSPDGRWLAGGNGHGKVLLWDMTTEQRAAEFVAHRDWAFSVVWFPEGDRFATGGGDNLIKIFALTNLTHPLKILEGHTGDVHALAISPDTTILVSGADDHTAIIWNLATGWIQFKLEGHTEQVPTLALSPDGKIIATGSRDETVRLWKVDGGEWIRTLEGHKGDVMSVKFSPDGRLLASASYNHTVRLWEVSSGNALRTLEGHTNRVFGVAFSPDGRQLASAGDSTVRLWNVPTGNQVWALAPGAKIDTGEQKIDENISSVVFSPDGSILAASSTAGHVYLIDLRTGAVRRIVR